MAGPARGKQPAGRRTLDTPIRVGTLIALALLLLGVFTGFDTYGSIGPVPVLVVAAVLAFVVGAGITVRRIMALRTPQD